MAAEAVQVSNKPNPNPNSKSKPKSPTKSPKSPRSPKRSPAMSPTKSTLSASPSTSRVSTPTPKTAPAATPTPKTTVTSPSPTKTTKPAPSPPQATTPVQVAKTVVEVKDKVKDKDVKDAAKVGRKSGDTGTKVQVEVEAPTPVKAEIKAGPTAKAVETEVTSSPPVAKVVEGKVAQAPAPASAPALAPARKVEVKVEVKPAPKTEVQPVSQPEVKPAPKTEVRPAPKSEVKPMPKTEIKDAKTEVKDATVKEKEVKDVKKDVKIEGGNVKDVKVNDPKINDPKVKDAAVKDLKLSNLKFKDVKEAATAGGARKAEVGPNVAGKADKAAVEEDPEAEPVVTEDQKVDPIARLVDALAIRLRRRQIIGSRSVALATATLVQNVVKTAKFATINDLIRILRNVGEQLNRANPKELSSTNIIRRIIKLINEEYSAAMVAHMSQPATPAAPSPSGSGSGSYTPTGYFDEQAPKQVRLSDFVAARHVRDQLERSGSSNVVGDFSGRMREMEREFERQAAKLKPVLIQAIDEVINELETTHEDVARGAKEHIHSSEVILTLGHSRTVEAFLKSAFRDRKFTVIVLESAPSFLGQPMAAALANHGIPTLLVPDSSLHAVMPRVTKVIFGAHSVSANGGLIALAGSLPCALAARTHAKPVVVTTGQFKFAPSWNLDHGFDALDFQGPGPVIGYDHNGGGGGYQGVDVVDPHYDYLRPELINLYVTNVGDHPPSYIYRITKEAYDDEKMEDDEL